VSDQGRYICRATNVDGEAEAVAEVFVNGTHYILLLDKGSHRIIPLQLRAFLTFYFFREINVIFISYLSFPAYILNIFGKLKM